MGKNWLEGMALTDSDATTVPVLPIGDFDTRKYGKIKFSKAMAKGIIKMFADKVLKTDIMIDVEHERGRSAGWVRNLTFGSFPHAKTGEDVEGLLAEVEWTPFGKELVDGKEYKYLSATIGRYHDEETGEDFTNVLQTVSLTNNPVMKLMPAIELAEDLVMTIDLGELTDHMERQEELMKASRTPEVNSMYVAFEPMYALAREAVADGNVGDSFIERVKALSADLPAAVEKALGKTQSIEGMYDDGKSPEGGESMGDENTTEAVELANQRADAAEARLRKVERAALTTRVDAVLTKLSEGGMDEASRKTLQTILLAEDSDNIQLSDGADAVSHVEALLQFAENITIVPQGAVTTEGNQPNDRTDGDDKGGSDVALDDATSEIASQLGIDSAALAEFVSTQKGGKE